MLEYSFLFIILATRFFQHYFNKKSSACISGANQYLSYGAYRYILSALMALALLLAGSKDGFEISPAAFFISLLAAASLAVNLFCALEAMKDGAMVLVNLAGSAGMLIPCILGIFMFGEPMSAWQFAGIGLLFIALYLLAGYSKKISGRFTFRTALLLAGSMLTNGAVMMAQKMYSLYIPGANAAVFSFLTFGIAGILFLIPLGSRSLAGRGKPGKLPGGLLKYGAILSVILLIINQLSTAAAAAIPSAVLFSVNDGGSTIISAIVAAALFGEKLNAKSICGLIFGIASLVVINMY